MIEQAGSKSESKPLTAEDLRWLRGALGTDLMRTSWPETRRIVMLLLDAHDALERRVQEADRWQPLAEMAQAESERLLRRNERLTRERDAALAEVEQLKASEPPCSCAPEPEHASEES